MKFDNISQELLIARGMYATCRAEHEAEKQNMARFCGALSAACAQVLRASQPANNELPDMVLIANLLADCRAAIDNMEVCAKQVFQLAEQRAALKPTAWPKRGN